MKRSLEFLTLPEVLKIHEDQIFRYGGSPEIRDIKLLESAVHTPEQTFGREYLHGDLFSMAAAYAYHISQNHPFVDGNKRTALATSLTFLGLNRIRIKDQKRKLYDSILEISQGKMNKHEFAGILQTLAKKINIRESLETLEDVGIEKLAERRLHRFGRKKALSHEQFWKAAFKFSHH